MGRLEHGERLNYPALDDARFREKFDIMWTYRRSSDLWLTYAPRAEAFEAALAVPLPERFEACPAVMFQLSAFDKSGRMAFAAQAFKSLHVESYGRALNRRKLDGADLGRETKLRVIARYAGSQS